MSRIRAGLAFLGLLTVGCGGDSGTGPSTTHDSLAGSYAGPLNGVSQGVALVSTLSVTLAQNAGALSGSYALSGALTDGMQSVDLIGTGTISGTVQAGTNPSVNIAVTPGDCPNSSANFSGAYDSANKRLTITGPIHIYNPSNCAVLLTYQSTIILNR